jgi:putative aldouronate transport system substrate-binding protein
MRNFIGSGKFVMLLFLNFSIIIGAFTGCQKNGSATSGSTQQDAVHTITIAKSYPGRIPSGVAEVEAEINKLIEPKINTKIKILAIDGGSYAQQVSLMLSSGEKLDLVFGMPTGTINFTVMHAQRQLTDITDLIPQYAPELVKTVNEVIPNFLEGTRVGGRIYSISCFYNKVSSDYFLARADYLDKYNLDIYGVKGLDDVTKILDVFKRNEPNMTVMVSNGASGTVLSVEGGAFYDDFNKPVGFDNLGDLVNRLAVVFMDNPGKVVNVYKTDNYRKQVERVHGWWEKGYVYKDAIINTELQEALVKSNIGMAWTTGSEIGVEAAKYNLTGHKVRAVKADPGLISTGAMTKFFWAVPVSSKESISAVKFLNLLYTDAALCDLGAWGIEGRDYVVKPDGTVDYPSGVTASTVPYHGLDFMWGNQFITKVWSGNPIDLREQAKKENQNALVSSLLGFSINTASIQNEVAALSNVISQYRPGLECGMVDPATGLPEFIRALEAAGSEKFVSEIQKQLDAWQAAKK